MKRLLLHACCGPCAEFPLKELTEEAFELVLYYYNPNIHPAFEWQRRLEQLQKLADIFRVDLLVEGRSSPEKWRERERNNPQQRCYLCYQDRLEQTAKKAAVMGFDAFLSTLQVSPYQDFSLICQLGHQLAQEHELIFLDRDFRSGFRQGQQMAREHQLYRQKYCGCIISLERSDFRKKIERDFAGLADQSKGS